METRLGESGIPSGETTLHHSVGWNRVVLHWQPYADGEVVMEELWSDKQLAAYFGMSDETLRHWRYEGRGPRYLKVGKRVRYRVSDVEAWLKQREDA